MCQFYVAAIFNTTDHVIDKECVFVYLIVLEARCKSMGWHLIRDFFCVITWQRASHDETESIAVQFSALLSSPYKATSVVMGN